ATRILTSFLSQTTPHDSAILCHSGGAARRGDVPRGLAARYTCRIGGSGDCSAHEIALTSPIGRLITELSYGLDLAPPARHSVPGSDWSPLLPPRYGCRRAEQCGWIP